MNNFCVNYTNNPDLKAIFDGLAPGDKCTLEIRVQLNEKSDSEAKCSVEKIEYESKVAGGETKTAKPEPEKPVMIVMKMGKTSKETSPAEAPGGSGY